MAIAREKAAAAEATTPQGAVGNFCQNILGTWAIVLRSRLFISLTFVMMAAGIVQEGLQDLLLQYLQLK
eukprot:scaffold648752_cov46-Prasinocladus_malaysianus.AAC.1